MLHAALTISPSAATAGPNIPLAWLPHPALSHIYWIKPSPSLSIASHPLSPLHGYILRWIRAKAGWLGTKVQITIRLNKLATEGDPKEREKLVKQINERVTYLYEGGKALGKTIDKIEKTING